MKKTVKDIEKIGESGVKWLKASLYYIYLPVVLIVGLKTLNMDSLRGPAQMWFMCSDNLSRNDYNILKINTDSSNASLSQKISIKRS